MDHPRRGSDAQGRSLNRLRTFAPVGRRTGLGAALTLALHVGAGAALLAYEPTRAGLAVAAPIMVDWIAAPKPPQPEPEVRPPKPKPIIKPRPRPPAPVNALWILVADTIAGSLVLLAATGLVLWSRLQWRRLAGLAVSFLPLALAGLAAWSTAS